MSQINIRNLSNENDDGSPEIVGVSTFSATSFFVPPKGTTTERPSDCEPGSIRFNTDTANLEYFRGKAIGWSQFELVNPNLGGGTGSNTGLGTRLLLAGGRISAPAFTDTIEFVTISTLGNAIDFGDLAASVYDTTSAANSTRILQISGNGPVAPVYVTNTITFVEIATTGNSKDFGDVTQARRGLMSNSNGHGGL